MGTQQIIRDYGALGLAGWSGECRGMVSAHRHLDLEINYVLSGTMTYLVGGRLVHLPPLRLCLLWGGVTHQAIRSQQTAEMIWVTIPLTVVLRWGLPERLVLPLLTTGFIADAAPRPSDLNLLQQWLADLPDRGMSQTSEASNATAVKITLLEIEARLRRLALGLAPVSATASHAKGDAAAHSDHGLTAVEAMADFISRKFQEAIGIEDIAREAFLHPNYAMTLFRQHTGMTLSQYLTLQRVAHAQRRLATSSDAIQEIGLESGFGSISRFYEAFQQQTGNSPRRFRLQMSSKALPTSE